MKYWLSLSFLVFLSLLSKGQLPVKEDVELNTQNERSVTELDFMTGTWQGDGWLTQRGVTNEYSKRQVIQYKADSAIIVRNSLTRPKLDTLNSIKDFETLGVMSVHQLQNAFTIHTFAINANMNSLYTEVAPKVYEWTFVIPDGTIRYREDFSETYRWKTIGDFLKNTSSEKDTTNEWVQFYEMNYKRVAP